MLKKAYMINFAGKSGLLDSFDYSKFHTRLTTEKGIDNWWHYLESCYIVITASNISATNISNFIKTLLNDKHFLVVELNLQNHNGWLPKEAWDWINKQLPLVQKKY